MTLGEVDFVVDGEPVDFAQTWTYKGFAYSDVPNLASSFGYINASWTLRADLTCEYVCRLLNHMDATGTRSARRACARADRDMPERPWIEGFSSGYVQRVLHLCRSRATASRGSTRRATSATARCSARAPSTTA